MQDIQLDDKKKAQLDGNIKKMLEGGANEDDIMQYASDFKNQFGQKKNPVGSQSSATQLPLPNQPINPLQQGANIVGGGVIGEISKTVPKSSIKEAALADKKKNESYLGALWNNAVGSVARLAGGAARATYQFSGNPVIQMERELLDKAGKVMGKNLLAAKEKEYADVVKGVVEKGRTSASSKEYERQIAEGFDVTNGLGSSDLKGVVAMLPQFIADMGLAAATGGGSFAIQGYDDALSMVDDMPEGSNISEGTRVAFGVGGALVVGALEKLGLDNLIKNPAAKKYVTAKVIKEATDELVKKGVKVTAEQFENVVKEKASKLTRKELTKIVATRGLKSAAVEGGTEAVQEGGMDLLKLAANKIEGKEIFDEEEMKNTAAKRYLNSLAAGGVLGGIGGSVVSRFQNTEASIKDRLKDAKTVEDIDGIVSEINDNVVDGTMTQEEADNVLPIVQNFVEVSQKVPADLNGKNKVEAVDLINEREKLTEQLKQIEEQKAALDPAFHSQLDGDIKELEERGKEINNQLAELAKPENNVESKTLESELRESLPYDHYERELNSEFEWVREMAKEFLADPKSFYEKRIETAKANLEADPNNDNAKDSLEYNQKELNVFNQIVEKYNKKQEAKPKEEVIVEEEIQQPIEKKTKQELLDEREKQIKDIKKKSEGTKEERDARYAELLAELGDGELAIKKMLEEERERAKMEIDKLPTIPKTENEIVNEKGENDFFKIKKDLGFSRSNKKWGNSPMDEDMGDALVSEDGNTIVYIKPNEVEVYDEENDSTDDVTNGVRIELVATKDEARGKGGAKKMIQKIVDWADKNGTDLFLDIAPQDKTTTQEGLKKLYELFDFEFDGIKGVRKSKSVEQPELVEAVRVEQEPEAKPQKVFAEKDLDRAKAKKVHQRVREMEAPSDAAQIALRYIADGGKVSEAAINEVAGTVKRARLNTGAKDLKSNEAKSRDYYQKDGETLDELAHRLWENSSQEVSEIDIKDALMSVIGDYNTRLEAGTAYLEQYNAEYIQEKYYERLAEEREEEWKKEQDELERQLRTDVDEQIEGEASEEHINNLIKQYESEFKAENQQPKPASKADANKEIGGRASGKEDGNEKGKVGEQPIGEAKPKQEDVEPKTPLEEKYEQINKLRGEKVKELAKQKLISDNFDSIVAQLMTKNKIKRQC